MEVSHPSKVAYGVLVLVKVLQKMEASHPSKGVYLGMVYLLLL